MYFLAPELYHAVYLIIIAIFTIIAIRRKNPPNVKEKTGAAMLMCAFMIWFIGNRPVHLCFGDMMDYAIKYVFVAKWEGFQFETTNLLYDNFFPFMKDVVEAHYTTFFQTMAFLFFAPLYMACKKMIPNHVFLSYLLCIGAFTAFGSCVNGMKAGVAASFCLVALAYRENVGVSLFFLFLSWGFHHSMQMVLAAYVLTFLFKNTKWYFYGWAFCFAMAIAGVTSFQTFFMGFSDEGAVKYLDTSTYDAGGFRPDFILYSVMPIVMGYFMIFKFEWKNKMYDILLKMYLTTNGIWLLCMYANFTNRIAYLSWFMYPLVLFYPCFMVDDKTHFVVKNRNLMIMGHLGFTMMMWFVFGK